MLQNGSKDGGVSSCTLIVCVNVVDVLLQSSVKFHVLTRTYSCGQVPGVVLSLNKVIVGVGSQLSIALGLAATAASIPSTSLHSTLASSDPAGVVTVGALSSYTFTMHTNRSTDRFHQSSL